MSIEDKLLLVLTFGLLVFQVESAWNNIGILIVENASGIQIENEKYNNEVFCLKCYPSLYNGSFGDIVHRGKPNISEMTDLAALSDQPDIYSCDSTSFKDDVIKDKFALLSIHNDTEKENCTVAERAYNVQNGNGLGMILDSIPNVATKDNGTNLSDLNIPVAAMLSSKDAAKLRALIVKSEHGEKLAFAIYSPKERNFDASLFVIMAMAVFTVAIGSLWSGYVKHELRLRQLEQAQFDAMDEQGEEIGDRTNGTQGNDANDPDDRERIYEQANGNRQSGQAGEEISLQISPAYILFFVVLMCAMLVMLYFFFDYLVYVIIGMFCLATTIAVYSCFEPVIMWSYEVECMKCIPTLRLPRCNLYLCIINMELRQALLLVASISISVVWLVFRKEDWAWILQDILGILFSINMLKVLRLPSLKICTILLSTLFFYDIFFVFITPLITKDGKSIMEKAVTGGKPPDGKSVMVEVATGGDTGEQLPMVLKVPHLSSTQEFARACGVPYSMLGFGDILVPGLLLSYCHSFDILVGTPCKIYWVITNIAYTLGIVATFVSLYLMKAAQPALLFLVPFTLLPVFLVSWARGEFSAMWKGDYAENQTTSKENSNVTANTGVANDSEVKEPSEDAIVEKQILQKNRANKSTPNGTYGTNRTESRQSQEENPITQE